MFYLTMQYMAGDDIQQYSARVMALNKCKNERIQNWNRYISWAVF